ncbi:MAG: hypothetical protein ACOCZH_03150 [Phototrophicaceae bacterium]
MPRPVRLIVALVVVLALALAVDVSPWLRGGYGWRWSHEPPTLARLLPFGLALVIYVAGALWLAARSRRTLPLLLWAALGTLALSLAVAHTRDGDVLYALFTRTVSSVATGPHAAAAQIDWRGDDWLAWSQVMPTLNRHAALSPPGLPLIYALLNDTLGHFPALAHRLQSGLIGYQCHNYALLEYTPAQWASAWFGVLMPLWAGLTVFPLYAAARRLVAPSSARWAALWWPLVPGVLAFAASWNTVYPLLATLALWLLITGLDRAGLDRRGISGGLLLAGAGAATGLGLFMNFALVPILGVFGFYTLGHYIWVERRRDPATPFWRPVMAGLWFGAGMLLVPWIPFMLAGGDSPLAILLTAMRDHLELDRPYWFWVVMHVWDWVLWTGLGLFALALVAVWRWRHADSPPLLAGALLLTLLIVTLSDTARGETGRVWLFLSPLLLVAAAQSLESLAGSPKAARRGWMAVTGGQAALALVVAGWIGAMSTPELFRPPPPPVAPLEIATAADVVFRPGAADGAFRLDGWSARYEAESDSIELVLQWRGVEAMTQPYWLGVLPVRADGMVGEMVLWQPGEFAGRDNRYPTTCWQPGQVVGDAVRIPLPPEAAGEWWLSLAAFGDDSHPEGRLTVSTPADAEAVQVGLGPVIVSP